ncbi:hypothetical protein HLH34_09345 [Gluconacetobacter azotocaptans]|uniref:Uncharacterized protein n=1 Tax=Gluconacetobacter azotocaptans TaxID=142834 RepID=A0A7W4JSM9_9PROT|nr:hypothetical protein [Gluconacetobacter azotocaptans]MBB2190173.1 hypothetical protein [Gluconacetobacter azotocaptans]MBM9403038.1 hypothetical protein [Gluconacetobacter azotocaptans]GBQ28770.1 hypothetical protein AA13594_1114 [Gluconacetobacter azotocaptans DSM 13594]
MTAHIATTRLTGLLILAASMAIACPAAAHRHHHREHTVYGNIAGYSTVIDPHGAQYQSDDAFCQTDATMAATPTATFTPTGGSQRVRIKHAYAACMESRGAWQRDPAAVSPAGPPPS